MSELLQRLGTAIRALRERHGLSVRALASRSALSTRFVSEVQAGRANISLVRLARLAQALGTTTSRLAAEAESEARPRPAVVALLGVRGAGKTTIGKELAARLGVEFRELDRLVEAEAGLPLAEIFATHGEAYFRRLEVAALRRFLALGVGAVLATGGGAVENAEAWKLLEEGTLTVWLRANADAHWRRVVRQGDARPMAGRRAAKDELRRLLARREPLYRRARWRVDTESLGVAGSVRFVVERVLSAGDRS
ncbi:MAG: helix-turn-helix domain-containing protein [Deltaproteobacteria bacterium]|nr:helix-turn-helix domain-containing protein [Deltaproteobacteria bacterium]